MCKRLTILLAFAGGVLAASVLQGQGRLQPIAVAEINRFPAAQRSVIAQMAASLNHLNDPGRGPLYHAEGPLPMGNQKTAFSGYFDTQGSGIALAIVNIPKALDEQLNRTDQEHVIFGKGKTVPGNCIHAGAVGRVTISLLGGKVQAIGDGCASAGLRVMAIYRK
jgi:hypothetical protein